MELGFMTFTTEKTLWAFTLSATSLTHNLLDPYVFISLVVSFFLLYTLAWASSTGGGIAWTNGRNQRGRIPIPGPKGVPLFGSLLTLTRGLAHRVLAAAAWSRDNTQLMAFSLGDSTPVVVSSDPGTAKQILTSPHFADRPIKQSAKLLMFSRAIGFAPNGTYWRLLRRISSSHLFCPRRILAHEPGRQLDCAVMLRNIASEQKRDGSVLLRKHLQLAALNNIMGSVFGIRYDLLSPDDMKSLDNLTEMVREGFELLGAFNWSDYLPWLSYFYDPLRVCERCSALVPRVRSFVKAIIDDRRVKKSTNLDDSSDFVDVLLSLDGDETLNDDDMIAVLWEMIFRGTDTTALLTEWAMAEVALNQRVQAKLHAELKTVVGDQHVSDADVAKLPYLQAVVKETLRVHPPGPLLSWARLSTSDVQLSNGMLIPAQTTAMVNMWAICHDPRVWEDPHVYNPERFLGADVDVRGGDLRLAPFGSGRRVCPGKNLGLAAVSLWVARLVQDFQWVEDLRAAGPVDLSEVLKLSCEMKNPLRAVAVQRN